MRPLSFLVVLTAGALFGFGLAVSTMIQPEAVLAFLHWENMGLLLVLAGATGVTLLAYQFLPRVLGQPLLGPSFERRPAELSRDTLVGAAIFGVGWGLAGVCPGPAIAGLGAANWPLGFALAGMFCGAWVQGRFFGRVTPAPGPAPA